MVPSASSSEKFVENLIFRVAAVAGGAFALAACEPQQVGDENLNTSQQQEATANNVAAAAIEPPPMVARSIAYRCSDGKALYVDVLTDENLVNVRDARQDLPVRLSREDEDSAFEGEGRSLSGRGDQVKYTAPDRPDQTCRSGDG